jgi:hypothetical protein
MLTTLMLNFACAGRQYRTNDFASKRVLIERHLGKRIELILVGGESCRGFLQSISEDEVCLQRPDAEKSCFRHTEIERLKVGINWPLVVEVTMVLAASFALLLYLDSLPPRPCSLTRISRVFS